MPENVKGGTLWDFLNIHSVAKYQKNDGGPFGAIKKFRGKIRNLNSPRVPKKGESLIVSKKVERGTLLLWNGLLSNVRGFEYELLSTYGKCA